ncbi:MAG: PEGA domain-containing protein [Myxococcota bacterium]
MAYSFGATAQTGASPGDESPSRIEGLDRAEIVAWTFDGPAADTETLDTLRKQLDAALGGESGTHVFGHRGLSEELTRKSADTPDCLKGLESCASPETLVFDALDLTLLIRVQIDRSSAGFSATYELVDRSGEVSRTNNLNATSLRELAFELAGDIFDATGSVTVQSIPSGAEVTIDGQKVGTTPLTYRLPTGEHSYTLNLPDYKDTSGQFELDSDEDTVIERELERLKGIFMVRGAPADAEVYLDGKGYGRAGESLEVEPGTYTVEVRAEGFEPYREELEIEPGSVTKRDVDMNNQRAFLDEVEPDAIALNSYIARLTYDHSAHATTFRGARGEASGTEFEFVGFTDSDGQLPSDATLRRSMDPNGLRLDFAYTWRNFGIVLLSTSYVTRDLDLSARIDSTDADRTVPVTVDSVKRLQLRPIQIRYRHFYDNFAPFVEAGTGINLQWVRATGELLDAPVTLYNSEAFWTFGIGAEYFVTPNVFGIARYSGQFYFDGGLGTEHVFSFGAGIALPNLFGFEPEPPEQL